MNPHFESTLNLMTLALNLSFSDRRWFISFGSLLNFIRDSGNLSGDIDVSVFQTVPLERLKSCFCQLGFTLRKYILDGSPDRPLFVSFERKGLDVDLFFWQKAKDQYYHTYDAEMINPKDGILQRFVFKGCPCTLMDGPTKEYQWPNTRVMTRFPLGYGALLDHWYPGWIIPNTQFGQSVSSHVVVVKKVRDLQGDLSVQLEKSKAEYEALKRRICGTNS